MRERLIVRASGPLIAVLMVSVDGFGVVIALPTIQADLDTSFAALQWVLSAYLLAVAACVILAGRFGDIFGRRRVLIVSMGLFIVGSLVCGLAPGDVVLVLGRVIQGAGGAGLYVLSTSLTIAAAPRDRMASAVALWAAIAGLGMAIGPIGYGVLIDLVDWRAVFLLNIPIMLIGIALSLAFLEESVDPDAERRVDIAGVVLLTGAIVMLVLGIIQADTWGWGSPLTLGLIAGSIVPFVAFWRVEDRVRTPLVELDVFARNLRFVGANAAVFGLMFAIYSFSFVMTIFLQDIQELSATEAAVRMLPWPIAFVITSRFAGRLVGKVGTKGPIVLGTLATGLSVLLASFVDAQTSDAAIGGIFALFGVSQAVGAVAIVGAVMSSVPQTKLGAASGTRATVSYISGSLGVAVAGAVLLARERARLSQITEEAGRRLTGDEQREIEGLLAGSDEAKASLADLSPLGVDQITDAAGQAFSAGLQAAMWLSTGVVLLGTVVYLVLTRRAAHADPGPVGHPALLPWHRHPTEGSERTDGAHSKAGSGGP